MSDKTVESVIHAVTSAAIGYAIGTMLSVGAMIALVAWAIRKGKL